MASGYNLNRYRPVKAWLASPDGRRGLARLNALGATWSRRGLPDEIVEVASKLECAPSMPPLHTFRDKASFLAGICWCLAFIKARSERS